MNCDGCGEPIEPPRKRWCSTRCCHRQYAGTCEICGSRTNSGRMPSPTRCIRCASAARRLWTRDTVVKAIRDWVVLFGRVPTAADWNPSLGSEEQRRVFYLEDRWPHESSVRRVFGSRAAAIRAAGFEPHPPGRHVINPRSGDRGA